MLVFNPQFRSIYAYPRRSKVMVVAISVILGISTLVIVAKTSTLSDFVYAADKHRLPAILLKNWTYRLTELGELFVNFPMSKMPAELHLLIPCIGAFLLLLILGGLVVKRREAGPTELFLLGYMAILFAWPFYDVRFLVASYSPSVCLFSTICKDDQVARYRYRDLLLQFCGARSSCNCLQHSNYLRGLQIPRQIRRWQSESDLL